MKSKEIEKNLRKLEKTPGKSKYQRNAKRNWKKPLRELEKTSENWKNCKKPFGELKKTCGKTISHFKFGDVSAKWLPSVKFDECMQRNDPRTSTLTNVCSKITVGHSF